MKNGQLRSESDRTSSIILLIILTVVAVGCILGMNYLFEYNFYEPNDNGNTARSVAVQIYSLSDSEQAIDYFNCVHENKDPYRIKYYEEKFSRENSNFVFVITDIATGHVLLDSTANGDIPFDDLRKSTNHTGSTDYITTDDDGSVIPVRLSYAIIEENDQQASDKYTHAFRWISAANSLKYVLFVVLFFCILLIIIFLCLLTINAGEVDAETGEIVPGIIDRLPLDFCTVMLAMLFMVAWVIISLTTAADVEMVLNNVVVMFTCVAAILVIQTYLTTLSVRVKMGKIYKNTIIYMIYRRFKRKTPRSLRRKVMEISPFRKLIAGIIIFFLSEAAILIALTYFGILDKSAQPRSVMLMFIIIWGITRLIVIPVFAMIAINLYYVKEEGQRLAQGVLGDEITKKLTISSIRAHGKNLDQIKKEIHKAVDQELKSEKLRNELITNVSHDIKTPLTTIKSYIEFLQRDNLTDEQRKDYLAIVSKHTEKLSVLANNLVEISQITSGNVEVKSEKTSLNIVIEQTLDGFALKLEENEILPRVLMPDEDVYIMGDGEWLWRIFSNLFNNACKYAAPGTDLEIKIETEGKKAFVYVSNISKKPINFDSDDLLERFVRGDSSRHTEGNGLGLSIAKSLAELQGGTLEISAKEENFTVILSFDLAEQESV